MAQGGIIIFEADNADFKNRKRAAKACASCQKRKKRCAHTFTKSTDQQAEKETAEKVLPQLIHKEPVKFVGDTNPESVLTDLTSRSKDSPRVSRVGIWVEQSRFDQEQYRRQQEKAVKEGLSTETDPAIKKQAAVHRYAKIERGRRTLTGHQKNYLQAVGALRVLPKSTQDALLTTYIACIDHLLPIIDCKKLLADYKDGEASVFLVQAICLVACKTPEAIPYLRLYEDGPLMDPIPFARALHTGLDAAMKADLEADRFTKVQIMTLMSLHNDGPGGIEESSLHLTMAIHDAQTTGLHINTPGRHSNDQSAMLWWTLWTLDKFNACLGGRPLMIADRDIDIKRPSLDGSARSAIMAIWLAMGDLLDSVIEFYRPGADPETAGWEGDFPSFEALTADCSVDMLSDSQKNLLEVCYNIIGILACRAGGPSSRSYNRRIKSADRIQQLTIQGSESHLPPLPLVPYAISLSLTVAYRGLRDSHCDPVKTQSDLAARCGILESLNKTWWTADAMAKLGRKALKNIQPATKGDDPAKAARAAHIGDALEAEVAPCKFGPFNGKTGSSSSANTDSIQNSSKDRSTLPLVRTGSDESNGLQVLSQAAATMGHGADSHMLERANDSIGKDNSMGRLSARNADFFTSMHPSKRMRYTGETMSGFTFPNTGRGSPHSNGYGSGDTPAANTQLSTLSHTSARTPMSQPSVDFGEIKGTPNPATGVFEINPNIDPFCATYDLQQDSSQVMDDMPTTDLATSLATTSLQSGLPLTNATHNGQLYNPRMSVPLHYSNSGDIDLDMYDYNQLDPLFDGFFDLSMPTIFQDPLFEGAAYDTNAFNSWNGGNSNGPSGAGSIDMNYVEQNQYNQMQQQNQMMGSGGNKRYSRGNMSINDNTINKRSPPDVAMSANHWCWDEEDY